MQTSITSLHMKKRTTLDVCIQAIRFLMKVRKFKALQQAIYELPFASLSR